MSASSHHRDWPNTRWHGIRPCERPSRFAVARFRMEALALLRPDFDAAVHEAFDRAVLGEPDYHNRGTR